MTLGSEAQFCDYRKGRLNVVKMPVPPNLACRFNATPIKITASYFVDIDNLILTSVQRGKKLRIANLILKENTVGGLTLPDLNA